VLNIPGIKDAEFEATAVAEAGSIMMRLWGNADLRVNQALGSFLESIDQEARKQAVGEVVTDVRELVFMNSSCLKEFLRWIAQIEERGDAAYRIRFISDATIQWQARSLHALHAFAPNLVTVELVPPVA
jgi:hypothetical protein